MGHYIQGEPYYSGRCYQRNDVYQGSEYADLNGAVDRVFVVDRADSSPIHNSSSSDGGEYNPACSCCYLGFAHSERYHAAANAS